jgi:hypothetical protein
MEKENEMELKNSVAAIYELTSKPSMLSRNSRRPASI